MRGGAIIGTLALTLALAACGSKDAPSTPPPIPVAIRAATAEPAGGAGGIAISGTVRLKRETQLGFNTPGRIAAISVLEGQRVGAGQVLARLDPTGIDAASASARAEAGRAAADLSRMATLNKQGWVTRARVESAQATAVAARARVTQAGFDARLSRIVAPASGVVLRRTAEPGQMVAAGTPILIVGETGSGYVLRLPVSDSDIGAVRVGQGAAVSIPALSPRPIAATVGEIAARGDERTGTFQVELRLPALVGLRSGMIGAATLRTGGQTVARGPVAVPASAVFAARADEGFVYVVQRDGTVKSRLVGLGAVGDRAVTITSGLALGERVARSGIDRLRDGVRVRVVE